MREYTCTVAMVYIEIVFNLITKYLKKENNVANQHELTETGSCRWLCLVRVIQGKGERSDFAEQG